ncbi:MAG: putative 2OG-Fe(II) oxygenase, partial [Alphaproteobacteria bacterium]|nr:putative 2OG-Fe(II) oxygenase [Alphaproteobacteria bacterium]
DMNLGAVLEKAGDLEAAKEAYESAIRLAPRYGDPYYNLGDIYLREARAEEAVAVFDRCIAACGRDFHALAYKAHALFDAGREAEGQRLLDFDNFVKAYRFDTPEGFDDLAAFNKALARHIKTHPTLAGNVMSTENGKHTGELIRDPLGPMAGMVERINEGIEWYKSQLPDDPDHPAVKYAPTDWRLTAWGVVMHNRGHERAHIHPNGWLSGVFYLQLPDVIEDDARAPEGWLEFGKPTADLHVRHKMPHRHFKPELGQMFLFPSYFYHGTVPFRSDQRRICVAFDVEPAHEPRRR